MSDDEVQLKVRVDRSLKDLVDADPRTNKDVVRAALWTEFGGERTGFLETKRDHKLSRADEIEQEGEEYIREAEQLRAEAKRLDEQINRADGERPYEEELDAILDDLENGEIEHIFPTHGRISGGSDHRDLARAFGRDKAEVLDDLKRRAAQQDRGLRVSHFKTARKATAEDKRTPIGEAVDDV